MARLPPIEVADQRYVYDYQVPIDGVLYRYRLRFFYRCNYWVLDFGLPDEWIIKGERAVVDTPLLRGLRDTRLPPGVLILGDTSNEDNECEFDDLGKRCKLYYLSAAPLLAQVAVDTNPLTVTRIV